MLLMIIAVFDQSTMIKTSFNGLECNMTGHCTRGLYFHSPSDSENMTHPLVQYPTILHSKPLNNIYLPEGVCETLIKLYPFNNILSFVDLQGFSPSLSRVVSVSPSTSPTQVIYPIACIKIQ